MHHCVQVYAEEQLPERHEDFLTKEPRRLEDLPQIGWAIASTALDH